jgi:hypothetical protein
MSDTGPLLAAIRRFVEGIDRSPAGAAIIEGLIIESFQEAPWFDEVSEALALFVPGSSLPYVDEARLTLELGALAGVLQDEDRGRG